MNIEQFKEQYPYNERVTVKKSFISKNYTFDEILDIIIELMRNNTTVPSQFELQKLTITQEVYTLLHSLIDDNFRVPVANGRGRKKKTTTPQSEILDDEFIKVENNND